MTLNDKFRKSSVEVYNIGTAEQTNVLGIAQTVIEIMKLANVKKTKTKKSKKTSGPQGRGWPGDAKNMQLAITKIERQDWKPRFSSDEAVRLATEELPKELKVVIIDRFSRGVC